MLRNATRELERRRRILPHVFQGSLISYRLPPPGCSRQKFASQIAFAARHEDAELSGFAQHDRLAEELSSRRSPGVGPITTPRRNSCLSLQSEYGDSINDRTMPRHGVPRSSALDRRRTEFETTTDLHADDLAQKAGSRYAEDPMSMDEPEEKPGWSEISRRRRRRFGGRTQLFKSWRRQTPNLLLKKVLESNDDWCRWKTRVAMARSTRLPIILLQMLVRREMPQLVDRKALPNPQEWDNLMRIVRENGHTPEGLDHYLYILQGETDDARCERFLEQPSYKPIFIWNFLVRRSSKFTKIGTLCSLIEHLRNLCTVATGLILEEPGLRQSTLKTYSPSPWLVNPTEFNLAMTLLAHHCLRLEPRLILKLAEVTEQYIEAIAASPGNLDKIYQIQCYVFNNSLKLLQPQPRMQTVLRSSPNAFFWEAQRILLAMSARAEQPLLVDQQGFRAIRDVLASLPKNQTEIHSSAQHAATWPPYLQPGDGMDEATDPEDRWSRAVRAGMLMQEAGFAKEERDDALDILQGMAPDGTPTIQQRASITKGRKLTKWEALIRATRNAQEAWERFRNPPHAGLKPCLPHYAAMFEKLVLREADINTKNLPGDKALNFPTQHEGNLAEFERARLQSPSVAQLYRQMRLDGIRPNGNCLRILVANAQSLDTAHLYLLDSTEDSKAIRTLVSDDQDPQSLRRIDMSLFSAYIQVLTRQETKHTSRHMMRAIRLAVSHAGLEQSPSAQFVWGLILKNLSQHHWALRISLGEQFQLFLHVIERISRHHEVPLSAFVQFSKCVRKVARRELFQLSADLASDNSAAGGNPLQYLYDQSWGRGGSQQSSLGPGSETQPPPFLLRMGAARMKELFGVLTRQEKESQRLLGAHQVAALDRMAWRRDPVRNEHVYEYTLSLAYVGEFEEMAEVLRWLVAEWGQPGVVEALSRLDEPPPHAEFFETLCAFRLFAEPMLEQGEVESLRAAIGAVGLDWTWPDDEAVETYVEMQDDESIMMLARVLEWIRRREGTREGVEEEAERERRTLMHLDAVDDTGGALGSARETMMTRRRSNREGCGSHDMDG